MHSYVIDKKIPHFNYVQTASLASDLPRVDNKQFLLTYKIWQSREPEHLRTLLSDYVSTGNLRSAERKYLFITLLNLVITSRAFNVAAHRFWNLLPPDITSADSVASYCKRLDTYLFSMACKH